MPPGPVIMTGWHIAKPLDLVLTPGVNMTEQPQRERLDMPKSKTAVSKITDRVPALPLTPIEQLDWFQVLDKKEQKKCLELAQKADASSEALVGAVSVYTDLVSYVRTSHLHTDLVAQVLTARGYSPVRISEVKRVAFGPEDVLQQLQDRVIGFKQALMLARGSKKQTAASLKKKFNLAFTSIIKWAGKSKDLTETGRIVEERDGYRITVERLEQEQPHVTVADNLA